MHRTVMCAMHYGHPGRASPYRARAPGQAATQDGCAKRIQCLCGGAVKAIDEALAESMVAM